MIAFAVFSSSFGIQLTSRKKPAPNFAKRAAY